jgi:hypothetical protein
VPNYRSHPNAQIRRDSLPAKALCAKAGNPLRSKQSLDTFAAEADPRTPDIVLKVNTGVIFTGGSKIAEHGGLNEDDIHVALLFSFPSMQPQIVKTPVLNQQVAPTILKALGLDPNQLEAVQLEQIPTLPFLPF